MSALRIRVATLEDAALLAELNRPVQDLHVRHEGHLYLPTNPLDVEIFYHEVLARGEMKALVAEDEQGAWGLLLYKLVERPASPFRRAIRQLYVDQLSVRPEARRRGVGRALMEVVHAEAEALGGLDVELDVRAFNAEAIGFYEALGYQPVGLRMSRSGA